jgi:hypothetical protein
MGRDRNDRGRYADGIAPETVLDVFDAREDTARPVTASDVVDELGIARRTAHNKLNALVERGTLDTRKIGARGRVWWIPDPRDADTFDAEDLQGDPETTLAGESGEDAARADAGDDATDGPPDPPADTHDAESGHARPVIDFGALSFDRDLTDARRSHLEAWIRHAAGADRVSKSEFEDWWTDERHGETAYNAGSFWEAFAKAAMKQSEQFTKPNTRTYRYTGEVDS